ncbi:MAG: cellulase family glycosylhydrolase [Chloroflexota bacterium]|nr:cellulase family glycosylhydrolase [Chloroflexota bacterium]
MNAVPFILGVNYWPRRKAMYWWSDFDAGEVREEFALIRSLGLQVVRVFLLWDDFQPTPDAVDSTALANLVTVCDIAAEHGLGLDVTFFTGHMSGPNWTPRWLHEPNAVPSENRVLMSGGQIVPGWYRNAFTDPIALAAERLQLQTVVGALKDHPAIWMWNLGNESDLFSIPPSAASGRAWVRDHVAAIRAIDPAHPVTLGLHSASLLDARIGLPIDQVYAETDIGVMHSYPMYMNFLSNPLDPDWVPFTCALSAALSGKPILMEEFGGCTAAPGQDSHIMKTMLDGESRTQFMASEDDLAAYFEAVLPRLVENGSTGAITWCFADYHESLWDRPPCSTSVHERFFGLVRPDGSLKPHAEVIRAFAATQPTVRAIPAWAKLAIAPDEFYADPTQNTIALYHTYLAQKAAATV